MDSAKLRGSLMTTMKKLSNGTIGVKEAREMTRAASTINQSLRFDIENKRENIKLMKATKKKVLLDNGPKALKIS